MAGTAGELAGIISHTSALVAEREAVNQLELTRQIAADPGERADAVGPDTLTAVDANWLPELLTLSRALSATGRISSQANGDPAGCAGKSSVTKACGKAKQ